MKNAFLRKIEMRCLQIFKNKFKLRWKSATSRNLNIPIWKPLWKFSVKTTEKPFIQPIICFFFKSIALFCEKKRNWIQTQNQADNRIAFVHSFAKTKRSRLTSLTFPGARQPRFVFPIFKSLRYWIIFSSPQGYRVSRKISDSKHKCKLPYKGFHFIIN